MGAIHVGEIVTTTFKKIGTGLLNPYSNQIRSIKFMKFVIKNL